MFYHFSVDRRTGKYEMCGKVTNALNMCRRKSSAGPAASFSNPTAVGQGRASVRSLIEDSAEVDGGEVSSSEDDKDGSADQGAPASDGRAKSDEMLFFPTDPETFDAIPLAGLAPPYPYQEMPAKQIAEIVRQGLDPSDTSFNTNHIGLVVADIPQGTSGEYWDAVPWSWRKTKKLLEWVGEVIKTYEPNSQNYNLIIICSWL